MAYKSFDPFIQKEFASFDSLDDLELEQIVNDVHTEYNSWKSLPVSKRVSFIASLEKVLLKNKEDYAEMITREMGKPISQSRAEIEKCALLCRYYVSNSEKFLASEERISSAGRSIVSYEPQGVILGIMPWNFPFWQALRFIVPALAAGNTVVLKHASNVPGSASMIESAIRESGFPENVFRNLLIDHYQVERLLRKNEIRGVSLTGSNVAGERIGEIAGRNIKRCVMELGGSDPFIIFSDADLESAVKAFADSRFLNTGQSCIAAKRLLVEKESMHKVIDILQKIIESYHTGNPADDDTFIGPMVSEKAAAEVERQVNESVKRGAKIIAGGKRGVPGPAFYEPTIIIDAPSGSPVLNEEVFGPVAPVIPFETEEEALIYANDTIYGLGASVWTGDREKAIRISLQIDTGTVAVNGYVKSDPAMPFGGVKDSGYGRELSVEGIREFVNIKSINIF